MSDLILSQAMIAAGDPIALELWEEYNQTVMTAYPTFSDVVVDVQGFC